MKIKFILSFFILSFFIFIGLNIIKNQNIEKEIEDKTNYITHIYKTILNTKKEIAQASYDSMISQPEVLELISKANDTKDSKLKDKFRKALLKFLKYRHYIEYNKKQDLVLFFATPDNKTFLRTIKNSDIHGDDISKTRDTVVYVNKYKEPISGYEQGLFLSGLRFVYPLSLNGKYLGTAELTTNVRTILNYFKKELNTRMNFIITKEMVDTKVKNKDDFIAHKITGFYFSKILVKNTGRNISFMLKHQKKILTKELIEKINKGLKDKKIFSLVQHNNTLMTFIPVFNPISKKLIGTYIVHTNQLTILNIKNDFWIKFIISILSLALIFIVVYIQFLSNQKTKKQHLYTKKILDSQTNFTLITDGKKLKVVNKVTLDFFGCTNIKEFNNKHDCICDLFIEGDGYLQKEQNGKRWIDIILENKEKSLLVKIKNLNNKVHIFQVNTSGQRIEGKYVITFTDITKVKEQEVQIIEKNTYISSILEASNEVQIIIDKDEKIIDFSNEASHLFPKIKKNMTIGHFFEEEEEEEEEAKLLRKFLDDVKTDKFNSYIANLQGRYFKVVCKPLNNKNGMIILYDVTELKQQEEALLAQSRSSAMGEMIAMISHQWRQPLANISAIIGFLDLSKQLGTLSDEQWENEKEKVNNILAHMSRTIEDFRDFFVSTDTLKQISIKDLVEKPFNLIGDSFKSYDSICLFEYNISEDTTIKTYPNKFDQVILNIYKNSLDEYKDNDIKGISKVYLTDDKYNFIIEISDNAGGISTKILSKIFEPYFSTKSKNGTGIGLHMSKTIIEKQLLGSIDCINIVDNNTDEKGVKFTISLPKNMG
jgi:nitrogen-specific signal transduction histidine kinase